MRHPFSFLLNFFPWHANVWKYLGESCLMPLQVDLVFAYHLHPRALADWRPELFLVFRAFGALLVLGVEIATSEAFKSSHVVFDGACSP